MVLNLTCRFFFLALAFFFWLRGIDLVSRCAGSDVFSQRREEKEKYKGRDEGRDGIKRREIGKEF